MPVGVRLDRPRYDVLAERLRANGGNISKTALEVGCTRTTAARAWWRGWPSRSWPAVGPQIEREQREQEQAVRASMVTQQQATCDPDREERLVQSTQMN